VVFGGDVSAALAAYERTFKDLGGLTNARFQGPLADQIQLKKIICRQCGVIVSVLNSLSKFEVELHGSALRQFAGLELLLYIFRDGLHITSCHDTPSKAPLRAGQFISRFSIPESVLRPGMYSLAVGILESTGRWAWCPEVAILKFSEDLGGRPAHRSGGVVGIPYTAQRIEKSE
jgi:hypothetical protein